MSLIFSILRALRKAYPDAYVSIEHAHHLFGTGDEEEEWHLYIAGEVCETHTRFESLVDRVNSLIGNEQKILIVSKSTKADPKTDPYKVGGCSADQPESPFLRNFRGD